MSWKSYDWRKSGCRIQSDTIHPEENETTGDQRLHGSSPYVKISTTDQGIIKIIDGSKSLYKTDGKETATIIFLGGD